MAGLDGLTEIRATASAGGTTVLLGRGPYDTDSQQRSMIWRSTDGRHWERTLRTSTDERLNAITAGGPGFVAVGSNGTQAAVWTSKDGATWRPVVDSAFDRGWMQTIVATRSGLVVFGGRADTDSRVIWTSPDGIEWLAATNESGLRVARGVEAVAAWNGQALAFVGPGDDATGRGRGVGDDRSGGMGTCRDPARGGSPLGLARGRRTARLGGARRAGIASPGGLVFRGRV